MVPQTNTGIGSISSPVLYWKMFCRFPSLVLGKVLGFPVHYWEIILVPKSMQYCEKFCRFLSTVKRVYRFTSPLLGKGSGFHSPVLGKGSIGSPVQYLEKVLWVPHYSTGKRLYRFLSPTLGKRSIGSPVQYWVKVVYVLKSNTGKRF